MWVKRPSELIAALGTEQEYILKDAASEGHDVVDYKDWTMTLTRRFRALKMWLPLPRWLVLRCYGVNGLRDHIRSHVRMAEAFEDMVRADERFEVVTDRQFALVCFRLRSPERFGGEKTANELNRGLLEEVNAVGPGPYMSSANVGGVYMLRCAVGSTLTEEYHVADAWKVVQDRASRAWLMFGRGESAVGPGPYMSSANVGGVYMLRCAVGSTLTEEYHVADAWKVVQDRASFCPLSSQNIRPFQQLHSGNLIICFAWAVSKNYEITVDNIRGLCIFNDPSLEPYDLSDDDTNLQKNFTHLSDLAAALRKHDHRDGVESALSSAEKLVRASPDELCHCSGDLVQAGVHVPCFRVKVEGEEDSPEENRQKALVALLMNNQPGTDPFQS
uniref:Tyrosine/DOPA decarboxylase 5 n=1 Tax=Aegilops tauschii TaxID=37682 RepID=R7W2B5_AEGTA